MQKQPRKLIVFKRLFNDFGGVLKASLAILGHFVHIFGFKLHHLGQILANSGQLGANLGNFGANLGQLGANRAHLGPNLAQLAPNLAQLGTNLVPSWLQTAAQRRKKGEKKTTKNKTCNMIPPGAPQETNLVPILVDFGSHFGG